MICIPIRPQNMAEAQQKMAMAACEGDLIELWIDGLDKDASTMDGLKTIIAAAEKPILAVCKPVREQGKWAGSEVKRMERLLDAIEAGAVYIDIGVETAPKLVKQIVREVRLKRAALKAPHGGPYTMISYHNFTETPSRAALKKVIQRAQALGADAIKIATQVTKAIDNMVLFDVLSMLKSKAIPAVVIGMGQQGKMTRVMMPLLGALWTYAPLVTEESTADGQMTVQEIKNVWQKIGGMPARPQV